MFKKAYFYPIELWAKYMAEASGSLRTLYSYDSIYPAYSVYSPSRIHPIPDDDILDGVQDKKDDFGRISPKQVFVMIALQAAPSRLLWRKARQKALDAAIKSSI